MNSAEIVAAVTAQAGVDATAATVLSWINEAYRSAVAKSQYRMTEYAFGNTVANQQTYAIPDEVVDIRDVTVGGVPYEATDTRSIYRLNQGTMNNNAEHGGYFAQDWSSAGALLLVLYPTPDTSGAAISGLVATQPAALDGTSGTSPILPIDTHEELVDLAALLGQARQDNDAAAAQAYQAGVDALAATLSTRKNSRAGSGSVQIRVRGVHYAG